MTAVSDFVLRRCRPGASFRRIPSVTNSGLDKSVRDRPAGRARRWASSEVCELREIGSTARQPEGAGAAQGRAGRRPPAADGQGAVGHAPGRVAPGAPARRSWSRATRSIWARLPVQTCWPDDAGPLITWGLVITRGPQGGRRPRAAPEPRHLPAAGDRPRQVIMRWLAHRGGALDFREFAAAPARAAVSDRGRAGRRPGDHPGRRHAGARQPVRIPVRRPAARQPDGGRRLPASAMPA